MIDGEAYELANTVTLYDADEVLVTAGKGNVFAALTQDDELVEFTAKDGVISKIVAKTLQSVEDAKQADKEAADQEAADAVVAKIAGLPAGSALNLTHAEE